MIDFGLRRATNVHWQALDVNKQARAGMKSQKPWWRLCLPACRARANPTVANLVEKDPLASCKRTRTICCTSKKSATASTADIKVSTNADRVENIRLVGEAANLFVDAGLIVLSGVPRFCRSARNAAWRASCRPDEFNEIFKDTPIEVCMQR